MVSEKTAADEYAAEEKKAQHRCIEISKIAR